MPIPSGDLLSYIVTVKTRVARNKQQQQAGENNLIKARVFGSSFGRQAVFKGSHV